MSTVSFRDYVLNAEKTYRYKIKAVIPLDDKMDHIERLVMKYDPVRVANPRKTIFQSNPMDFPNVGGAEVYIVDVEFGLPASIWQFTKELQHALGVPEKFIVVRDAEDPIEIDIERIAAESEIDAEAEKKGLKPASLLSTSPENDEVKSEDGADFYGAKRNSELLSRLANLEKERAEKSKVEPQAPLFDWLAPEAPAAEGAPEADASGIKEEKPVWRKVFKDKNKNVVITRKRED